MNFATWEPAYGALLRDFGYDRAADERVRDRLAELTTPFDEARLGALFEGATVAVAGAASSLPSELEVVRDVEVVVAASSAADVCLDHGLAVDLVVTDLDKAPATVVQLAADGVPAAVHAHGDNGPAIERWVPEITRAQLLPTTQAAPVGPVVNYGGFTDGDRGAFLADHFGATELRFPGWDFDDATVDDEKARKLDWAERLLAWLERRRGERFDVLDGRREAIELPWT